MVGFPKAEETFLLGCKNLFICETQASKQENEANYTKTNFVNLKELFRKPSDKTVNSNYSEIIKTYSWNEALKSTSPNTGRLLFFKAFALAFHLTPTLCPQMCVRGLLPQLLSGPLVTLLQCQIKAALLLATSSSEAMRTGSELIISVSSVLALWGAHVTPGWDV